MRWANADIFASEASSMQSCIPGPDGEAPSMVITWRQRPGLRCGIWLAVKGPDAAVVAAAGSAEAAAALDGAGLLQAQSATRAAPARAAAIERRMDIPSAAGAAWP